MGFVSVCLIDGQSQCAWPEMGTCHSKKCVTPDSETPERSSLVSASASSQSDMQPNTRVSKESLDTGQMTLTSAQLKYLEVCLKEAEEKAKALTEQLAVSEETKAKLLDQVCWLEKQLETINRKEAREESYEEMVLKKDQCIEKLQAEVKASQEQLKAHKLKHRKKVEKLQTDLATAKQEAAFTVLELKEKIKRLCEGKPAPRDQWPEELCGKLPPVEAGDRKISLIMELSSQLSLQTEKISHLEEVLEEKEKKIQELEAERSSYIAQDTTAPPECV
ncbi:coiled-coil domain-containing protein 192 isoform X2 [Dipodomys merriami]|uniref:coiled-coil domain-containing protein 192 isoform X2 n=1 Tax=Dipodomys merriami TaxID=94247 RepID=UPI003855DF19